MAWGGTSSFPSSPKAGFPLENPWFLAGEASLAGQYYIHFVHSFAMMNR